MIIEDRIRNLVLVLLWDYYIIYYFVLCRCWQF